MPCSVTLAEFALVAFVGILRAVCVSVTFLTFELSACFGALRYCSAWRWLDGWDHGGMGFLTALPPPNLLWRGLARAPPPPHLPQTLLPPSPSTWCAPSHLKHQFIHSSILADHAMNILSLHNTSNSGHCAPFFILNSIVIILWCSGLFCLALFVSDTHTHWMGHFALVGHEFLFLLFIYLFFFIFGGKYCISHTPFDG